MSKSQRSIPRHPVAHVGILLLATGVGACSSAGDPKETASSTEGSSSSASSSAGDASGSSPTWDDAQLVAISDPTPIANAAQAGPIGVGADGWSLGGVGVDAEGDAVVAYRQTQGSAIHVVASRFTPKAGWGQAIALDGVGETTPQFTVNGVVRPLIAMSPSVVAYATWTAKLGTTTDLALRSATFAPSGGWGAEVTLQNDLFAPVVNGVAATPTGALVVWDNFTNDFNPASTTGLSSAGLGGATTALTTDTSEGESVATNAAGDGFAIWIDKVPNQMEFSIKSLAYHSADGWDSTAVAIPGSSSTGYPDWQNVAVDDLGDATAVWVSGSSVEASRFEGVGWSSATSLQGSVGSTLIDAPSVCAGANGDAFATWTSGASLQIAAYHVGAWTSVSGPALAPAHLAVDNVMQSRCVVDSEGKLMIAAIVWSGPDGATQPTAAEVQVLTYDGGTWGPAQHFSGPANSAAFNPQVGINTTGTMFVAWEETSPSGTAIWATRRARR